MGRKKEGTARKTAPKRAKGSRRRVDGEQAFCCVDGRTLHSLVDLALALDEMADDTFYYHANQDRNDFSEWIKGVFQLEDLSEQFRGKDKGSAQIVLCKHVINDLK